jgi:integrase
MVGSVIRLKGLKRYRDPRDGRIYCYHRATGRRLKGEFGSAEFLAEFAEIEATHREQRRRETLPRTLGDIVGLYTQSSRFSELAPRTRKDYVSLLSDLASIHKMPLAAIDKPFLARLRDEHAKRRGWHRANYLIQVLSQVFKVAEEDGVMKENPALRLRKLKRPKDLPAANRPWTEAERRTVLDAAAPHLRLPLAIGALTGLRIADIVTLPKTAFREGWLRHETRKRLVEVVLPVTDELRREILRAPAHAAITLCANSFGQPWTEDGLRCSFGKLRAKLESAGEVEPGLTIHGLRHAMAAELAENGINDSEIACWLGQKTTAMARHYSSRGQETAHGSHGGEAAIPGQTMNATCLGDDENCLRME